MSLKGTECRAEVNKEDRDKVARCFQMLKSEMEEMYHSILCSLLGFVCKLISVHLWRDSWKDGARNQFFIAFTHYGCECNGSIVVVYRCWGFSGTGIMVDVLQREVPPCCPIGFLHYGEEMGVSSMVQSLSSLSGIPSSSCQISSSVKEMLVNPVGEQ